MLDKAEVFIFSDVFNQIKDLLVENNLLFITGKLSNRQNEDDILKIIADDIIPMKNARAKLTRHVNIKIPHSQNDKNILNSIKSLTDLNKGNCRFVLNIETSSGYLQRMVAENIKVSHKLDFIIKLRELMGFDNVWIDS